MQKLKVGEAIPKFSVVDEKQNTYTNETLLGKKWIIYFYPKDNTPGCINQACNLRDGSKELKKLGYSILGVSMDSEITHQKFIAKQSINFPLLVDENKELINAFGVWGPKKFMGKEYDGIHRTTFIINEFGKITHVIEKPKTKLHTEEIIQLIKN